MEEKEEEEMEVGAGASHASSSYHHGKGKIYSRKRCFQLLLVFAHAPTNALRELLEFLLGGGVIFWRPFDSVKS